MLRLASLTFLAINAVGMATGAIAQIVMRNATVGSGAAHRVANGTYALEATVGEPVAGPVSSGGYQLQAGFQSTWKAAPGNEPNPLLFADGFED